MLSATMGSVACQVDFWGLYEVLYDASKGTLPQNANPSWEFNSYYLDQVKLEDGYLLCPTELSQSNIGFHYTKVLEFAIEFAFPSILENTELRIAINNGQKTVNFNFNGMTGLIYLYLANNERVEIGNFIRTAAFQILRIRCSSDYGLAIFLSDNLIYTLPYYRLFSWTNGYSVHISNNGSEGNIKYKKIAYTVDLKI